MMKSILLVSDKTDLKTYFPPQRTLCITFDVLTNHKPPNQDIVLFYGLTINQEMYSVMIETLRDFKGFIFGVDLEFMNDFHEGCIFEHVYQNNSEKYEQSIQLMCAHNVSFVPSFETINQKFTIGVIGDTYTIDELPTYDNISYSKLHDGNKQVFNCDAVIIVGDIDIKLTMSIITSCKPYIIYSPNEPHTLHNFLLTNVQWGQVLNNYNSKHWWSNFYHQLHSVSRTACILQDGGVDEIIEPIIKNQPNAFINLDPYVKYAEDVHRSGWKYVIKGLSTFERPLRNGLLFDSCVDGTFLWEKDNLIADNKIPYTREWVGVIHHTFSEHCGPNNCVSLFDSPVFIESLKSCNGLIVMSNYLRQQILEKLSPMFPNIPVHTIKHPTEFVTMHQCFHPSTFDNTITHIGDFLRNKSSFIDVNVGGLKKQMLISKRNNASMLSMSSSSEKFESDLIENIGPLDDNDYDCLLKKTIVFINLHDASACNTLIECIVRQTPIIVNKHPAVVEYIGQDYPGLYESLNEVSSMCSANHIRLMYNYLHSFEKNIKTDLSLSSFLNNINNIVFKNE